MTNLLTNGTTGTYEGSIEENKGAKMRVLGHHMALNGEGSIRYIIAILNGQGDPIQTLSNTRRESLTNTVANTR